MVLVFPLCFQAILDVTINLQFTLVETLWKTFWRFEESQSGDTGTLAVYVLSWDFNMLLKQLSFFFLEYQVIFSRILCHFLTYLYCCNRHDESEKRLPKDCLVILCKYDPVLRWSRDCDNTLYQGLVEILIPDVLRPIPSELERTTQHHIILIQLQSSIESLQKVFKPLDRILKWITLRLSLA